MGASKSKNVAETARHVLSKRTIPTPTENAVKISEQGGAAQDFANNIHVQYKPVNRVPSSAYNAEHEMNADLLKEVSKWPAIETANSSHSQVKCSYLRVNSP